MSRYAMLGAALLAAAFVAPVSAQAVVEDPGYCAQFYPNANCHNYGPGNPLYPGCLCQTAMPECMQPGAGVVAAPVRPHRRHHR